METLKRKFSGTARALPNYLEKRLSNSTENVFNNLANGTQNNSNKKGSFSETYYNNLEIKKRPRLVKKCGELNINMENVPKHKRRLLSDFFNTILDIKWRWHIVIFLLSFMVSWFIFATVWYTIALVHGDLSIKYEDQPVQSPEEKLANMNSNLTGFNEINLLELIKLFDNSETLVDYLYKINEYHHSFNQSHSFASSPVSSIKSDEQTNTIQQNYSFYFKDLLIKKLKYQLENLENNNKKKTNANNKTPCVHGIHDFTSALLYSVETQHTIGYGLRHITEECSFAIVFLMIQSCFGIFVQGLVAGVVFAKISRPNKRKRTIIFSHNAVVTQRDGKLCFMFKIGNVRISQLSDATIKLLMIKSRRTSEGEFIPFQSYEMKVGRDFTGNSIFFPWPKTVEHIIDESSPLYEICKDSITRSKSKDTDESSERTQSSMNSSTNTITTSSTEMLDDWEDQQIRNVETAICQTKNEDYEIVVMLEGNIETTGASCHIRTSYLPQEILFGYRFTPIYPQFTNFEYWFDYSKFDQVEPIQHNLMHLNVAHINKHLNYIFDARDELKNYQLTYQNTLNQEDLIKFKKINNHHHHHLTQTIRNQPVLSLSAVLSAFKANQMNPNETNCKLNKNPCNIDNKNTSRIDEKNEDKTLDSSRLSPCQQVIATLKETNLNVSKMNSPCDNCDSRPSRSLADYNKNNDKKSGRFTIVPVERNSNVNNQNGSNNNESKIKNHQQYNYLTEISTLISTNETSKNNSPIDSNSSSSFNKKRKPVNFLTQLSRKVLMQNRKPNLLNYSFDHQNKCLKGNHHPNHLRTNSLPPIHSQIQLGSSVSLSKKETIASCNANNVVCNTSMSQNELGANSFENIKKGPSFFIDDEGYLTSNKNNSKEDNSSMKRYV